MDDTTTTGTVLLNPTPTEALHELLMSTPPLREFHEDQPNTYVFSEACEMEATRLHSGRFLVHSVTTR